MLEAKKSFSCLIDTSEETLNCRLVMSAYGAWNCWGNLATSRDNTSYAEGRKAERQKSNR